MKKAILVIALIALLSGVVWGGDGYIPLTDDGVGVCIDDNGYLYVCKGKEEKQPCDCGSLERRIEKLEEIIERLKHALLIDRWVGFESGVTYMIQEDLKENGNEKVICNSARTVCGWFCKCG